MAVLIGLVYLFTLSMLCMCVGECLVDVVPVCYLYNVCYYSCSCAVLISLLFWIGVQLACADVNLLSL